MNVLRLQKLVDLLEADAANPKGVCFNLNGWAGKQDYAERENWSSYDMNTTEIPVDCQTAACALGLAAISGIFKSEGLGWKISSVGSLIPTYREEFVTMTGYRAAEAFFDLLPKDVSRIFDPGYYPSELRKGEAAEKEMVRRIRILLAGGNLNGFREYF